MARLNVPARNGILDSGANGTWNNGKLCFYSGSRPATANLAPSGTKLWEEDLPADAFAAADSGAIAKAGTWSAAGVAAGDAGYGRFKASGDDDSLDGAFARMDCTLTATGGGGEIVLDNVTIAIGQIATVNTFTVTLPAGS